MRFVIPSSRRLIHTLTRVDALTNMLTGKSDVLAGQINDLTKKNNALAGELNDLTGRTNVLTGQANGLTGRVNNLTGQVNILTGQVNNLTGHVNILTGQVNELIGKVNILTGQVNDLTRERDTILGEIRESSRANAAFLPAGATDMSSRCSVPDPSPLAVRKPRRGKFLILGNMRTGSTWLETLLGALPDVVTEFELKWRPRYAPLVVHRVLDTSSPTVDDILEAFESVLPVAGSKLVLDLDYLSPIEFTKLAAKLSPEIRVIHLTRDLRSIFFSRRRGVYHRLNRDSPIRVSERIRAAIDEADIDRAKAQPSPEWVHKSDCYDELATYVRNDARLAQLRRTGRDYLLVDYAEIEERMTEIARFAGSEAAPDVIAAVLANSPTIKLPPVQPEQLVTNLNELGPLFEHFEALRSRLLDEAAAPD
jgi:uncharacterized protein YoxC